MQHKKAGALEDISATEHPVLYLEGKKCVHAYGQLIFVAAPKHSIIRKVITNLRVKQ